MDEAAQTTTLLLSNLNRASDLVASFKQVAVDQTSEAERDVDMKEYIREVTQSLAPKFKKTSHEIDIDCPDDLVIKCAPGAIAQIVTNMIMNSLIHGFENIKRGQIQLKIWSDDEYVHIDYSDNGKGLKKEMLEKHFDAFFTTRRGKGGSGLGTHIMYNLVTQSLGGKIEAESEQGKGLNYYISFPKNR